MYIEITRIVHALFKFLLADNSTLRLRVFFSRCVDLAFARWRVKARARDRVRSVERFIDSAAALYIRLALWV